MFSIFNRKKNLSGLEWLGVDIHSHLLPGIDDGSPDIVTSEKLIAGLKGLGLKKLITTPHVFNEMYPNNSETISSAYNQIAHSDQMKDVGFGYAAEYMLDDDFEKILDDKLLCVEDKYVLVEMSYLYESPKFDEYIFNLQLKGYQPILAHPERYRFYHGNMSRLKSIKNRGVLFQINLLSLCGYYGKAEKIMALDLVKTGLIDLAGTDLHHEKHLKALQRCSEEGVLYKYLGEEKLQNNFLFAGVEV